MVRKRKQQLLRGPTGGVQLVLMRDVAGLGRHGDVVEVKPGYARNYLIPRGLASPATPHNLRLVDRRKRKLERLAEERRKKMEQMVERLSKVSVSVEAAANVEGHLYGSVGEEDIARAFQAQGYEVTPEMVRLEGPIKELGLYNVRIEADKEHSTEVKVWVVPLTTDEGN